MGTSFDSPYGSVSIRREKIVKHGKLLFPIYTESAYPHLKGMHHHIFLAREKNYQVIGLAYTCYDDSGLVWREYYEADGNNWKPTFPIRSSFYRSYEELENDKDFGRFLGHIVSLGYKLVEHQNKLKKEQLCIKAESLSESTDWKATNGDIKALQAEWKTIGFAGKDFDDQIWNRFKSAIDKFYERQKQHFNKCEREREENRAKKEKLCKEAESLCSSKDWKATTEAFKNLQEKWKETGSAGRDHEEKLWQRFSAAKNEFYGRKTAFYKQREEEQLENLRQKEKLCKAAESLMCARELDYAVKTVKELQAQWKTIGHVPREEADQVWQRFQRACDAVFAWLKEEKERKQAEWRDKMLQNLAYKREKVTQLRDSIIDLEAVIDRKRDTIYHLRPGGRADEIRNDLENQISQIESKISSKRERIEELELSIRDIEQKLYS